MTHAPIKILLALGLAFVLVLAVFLARGVFSAGTTAAGMTVSQRVLLGDNSLDVTAAQRAEALRIFGEMADLAAADEGVLAAAPFQATALATITWPINHRFAASPADPNAYYRRLDLTGQAKRVKEQARTLFAGQSGVQGTDIVGGLIAASEFFASQPNGPRTLVLASNMWAVSPDDDLRLKTQRLTPAQITRMVDRLARQGKIARLEGVCVYVVGAGLNPKRPLPTSVQLGMRDFWRAYFARTGARVRAWVPTLQSAPSC